MDKKHSVKSEKSESITSHSNAGILVKYGFWVMIALLIINIAISYLKQPIVGYVTEALFYIAVIFVFVNSVRYLMPEGKGFVVIALIVSSVLVLFMFLMMMVAMLTTMSAGTFG
jgi:hypothetical protein